MDNNNPANQPIPPQPNIPQAPPPPPPPQPAIDQTAVPDQSKSSKKLLIILVVGFLLTIALVAAAYMFVNSNKSVPTSSQTQTSTTDNLESDLNAVSVEDIEMEFTTVDADLQNL